MLAAIRITYIISRNYEGYEFAAITVLNKL